MTYIYLISVSLNGPLDELIAVFSYMEQLKSSTGHNLSSFIEDFEDVNKQFRFQGLNINSNMKGIDSANISIQALLSATITYLE